jgi:hypothetical protein
MSKLIHQRKAMALKIQNDSSTLLKCPLTLVLNGVGSAYLEATKP